MTMKPAEERPASRSRNGTAWIVDDDHAIQTLLARALREAGLDSVSFQDAEAVISAAAQAPRAPALLSVDVMMPGMSGFSLVRSLRARRCFEHVPIIIATARVDVGDAVLAARLGATLVTKPFRLREYLLTVERLIEQSQLAHPGLAHSPR
jgi:two-component system nitrogen regulation response regulator GlnG